MGQRRKVRPGDRDFRQGVLGEYWLEWGEGEVLEDAMPPGRSAIIETSPKVAGHRNAILVIKPAHLQEPMALTVDTTDRRLPAVCRDDPCALIGHTIGYRAIVRRTRTYVQAAPENLNVPIDKVPGLGPRRERYKVRELIEVLEIDGRDPLDFTWSKTVVVEADPGTWPERGASAGDGKAMTLEQIERLHTGDRVTVVEPDGATVGTFNVNIRDPFGMGSHIPLDAKVHAARMSDRALRSYLERLRSTTHYQPEHFVTFRAFTFDLIERVLRQIEGDFDDRTSAFLAACDLIEGALSVYLVHVWPISLDDAAKLQLAGMLVDYATGMYQQVSDWRID